MPLAEDERVRLVTLEKIAEIRDKRLKLKGLGEELKEQKRESAGIVGGFVHGFSDGLTEDLELAQWDKSEKYDLSEKKSHYKVTAAVRGRILGFRTFAEIDELAHSIKEHNRASFYEEAFQLIAKANDLESALDLSERYVAFETNPSEHPLTSDEKEYYDQRKKDYRFGQLKESFRPRLSKEGMIFALLPLGLFLSKGPIGWTLCTLLIVPFAHVRVVFWSIIAVLGLILWS